MSKELTLSEIQKCSLDVLLEFKKICDENNFKFYLTYGTLIGAARHSGFIPWDDDIDVWMPRRDYELFLNYCHEHFKQLGNYRLFHFSNTNNYPYCIARFSDTNFYTEYKGVKNYGLGSFIDLYPLDAIDENDKRFYFKQKRMIKKAHSMSSSYQKGIKGIVLKLYYCTFLFFSFSFTRKNYLKRIDKRAQKFNDNDNVETVAVSTWEINRILLKNDIVSIDEKKLFFEGYEMPVPREYDKVLNQLYGDYMKLPPEEERINHHFYKMYKK